MNEPNTIHPETLFHQSLTARIKTLLDRIEQKNRLLLPKQSRRSSNWRQGVVTSLTRTLQHRKSCIQGYRAKARLAKDSKGHNTTSGIPETFLSLV